MSLVDEGMRSASVVTLNKTLMLIMTKKQLDKLILDMPRLAALLIIKLAKMMSERLRQTSGALAETMEKLENIQIEDGSE